MNSIPAVEDWKRIFIDTSFIIDTVRNSDFLKQDDSKFNIINKTHQLLEYFLDSKQSLRWITSSIVLSELSKFENTNAVGQLQKIFNSSEIEIVNFTPKEAGFITSDFANYIEQKHVSVFFKEMTKALTSEGVFNAKNYVTNDALIIACAKSKRCDVVLSSDEKSFMPIAKQVNLPILLTKDLPTDMYGNIDHKKPIITNY